MALIWTLAEAEAAWRQGRTQSNLAQWFRALPNETSMRCGDFVDGRFTRVEIFLNEAVKRWTLSTRAKDAAKAVEDEWRKQGCVKDSSGNWEVPYELIWRSLPHGEDR